MIYFSFTFYQTHQLSNIHPKSDRYETSREERGGDCISSQDSHDKARGLRSSLISHICTLTQAYVLDIKIVQDQASAFYLKSLNLKKKKKEIGSLQFL